MHVRRYLDPDDIRQEAELARLLAERDGADPDVSARRAADRADKAEQRRRARERTNHGAADEAPLGWLEEARKVVARQSPAPPGKATARPSPVRLRREWQDALILMGSMAGLSGRQIGEAMGLSESRIRAGLARAAPAAGLDPYGKNSSEE